jgi:hypothetical protein
VKPQRAEKGLIFSANGANGMSDIEGKVAREAMSECGQRASFNAFGCVSRRVSVRNYGDFWVLDVTIGP